MKTLEGRLDKKLFNKKAFKQADRIERIMMVMVAGPKGAYLLTEAEQEYACLLEDAYTLIKEQRSQSIAAKMMRDRLKKDTHRRYSALQVMRDAVNLYGRFENVHRPIQRSIVRENLLERIKVCEFKIEEAEEKEQPVWEKLLQKYWEQLANLDTLDKVEDAAEIDNTLPKITLTANPSVLMDQMAEDIDSEEL